MNNKPDWMDLESIIPLATTKGGRDAEQITGLSADTIKRRFPEYVKQLSERRRGIKLRHALEIADGQPRKPRRRNTAVQHETQSEI
jgi:hypothetical protein